MDPELEQTEEEQLDHPVSQFFNEEVEVPNTDVSTITLLDQMLSQETIATRQSQTIGALPDSQFILTNQQVERLQTLTTTTKAGRKAVAGTKRKPPAKKTDVGGAEKKSRATRKSKNLQTEGEGRQEGSST